MKIVSFNINSVRARPHQLEHIRDTIDPDVIGLQETKVNDPEFPIEVINEIGYHAEYWGQKGHYGVAFLSKKKPENVQKGFVDARINHLYFGALEPKTGSIQSIDKFLERQHLNHKVKYSGGEVDKEKTYICTCYGKAILQRKDNLDIKETVKTSHHDEPRYIYIDKNNIEKAPVINHTDLELIMLEEHVSRKPPFVGKDGKVKAGYY